MHLLQKIIKADLIITAAPNAKSIGVKDGRHKNTIESKATFGWLFYCVLWAREQAKIDGRGCAKHDGWSYAIIVKNSK